MNLSSTNWAFGFPVPIILPAIAVSLVALYSLCYTIYNLLFHPLRSYPGPLLWRGTNLGKIRAQLSGGLTNSIHRLHQEYGPVVRVAPGELSYISAQAWKDIYSAQKGVENTDPNIVYGQSELEMFGAQGIMWQANVPDHIRHRRALAPAFSDRSLREQETVIKGHVDMLIQRFRERAGTQIDLCEWFNYTSFDVIGDLVFGESFGCLEKGELHPWIGFIFGNLKNMMYDQILTTLGGFGHMLRMLLPEYLKEQVRKHAQTTRTWVMRAVQTKTERPGFMMHFAELTDKEDGISLDELIANANLIVIAGSETLVTVLSSAAYYSMKNPEVMKKLRAEIYAVFEKEEDIDFNAVSTNLPYMVAVLTEALRMHPPVPVGIHKLAPHAGVVIDGKWVPGGTDVVVHQWSTYRSATNFRDPDLFVPERWLGDEWYADDDREAFQPFGVGPRSCIGRGLAYMESRMAFARLIWNFDLELMPDSEEWEVQKTWILYEKPPLNVRLTPVR
ncbi:hypothetical protein OQA88_5125 [Cercophora sp. LCS_1]